MITPAALAESHRRQYAGEDYQYVAISLADLHGITYESDEFARLMSSPDPECRCAFCKTAKWED